MTNENTERDAQTLRDKIAEHLRELGMWNNYNGADNILGIIKANVPELVWSTQQYRNPDQIGHHANGYAIYEGQTGNCVLSSGAPHFVGPVHTDTIEAAKAEANAHNVAQKTDWMMK